MGRVLLLFAQVHWNSFRVSFIKQKVREGETGLLTIRVQKKPHAVQVIRINEKYPTYTNTL